MKLLIVVSSCLLVTSVLSAPARADDAAAPAPVGPTAADITIPKLDASAKDAGVVAAPSQDPQPTGSADDDAARKKLPGIKAQPNITQKEQGSQGIGFGGMTGNATDGNAGPVPQALQLEYYNVGKNPTQSGSGYGLSVDKLEFSGVDQGLPEMALEMRGMSGWQLIGASDKHPVMFHLGVEPLNFEGQITTNIYQDARNTAARIAQNDANSNGAQGQGGQVISQIGNPDAPIARNQWLYYVPAVSMGLEVRKAGCRFLGLVRGGAAGGGQLRTDGYSYGVNAAYGAGIYMNCPQVDVDGEWTRIQQPDAPMDLLNADVMVKPFKNIPLAIGTELGSTITNSEDPKDVPLEAPGFGVKGASVETHASGVVRITF